MRRKPTYNERQIAKALDISDAQLLGLLQVKAGRGSGNVGHHLVAKGLAANNVREGLRYAGYITTPAGEALLARARAMGY